MQNQFNQFGCILCSSFHVCRIQGAILTDEQMLQQLCLFIQNPKKQGPDTQGSTAELITGLVQLVPQASMPEIAQEAMEVRKLNWYLHLEYCIRF